MGGPFEGNASSNYYTGMQYQPKWAPIVLNGVLYYQDFPGSTANKHGWVAVNLRTGQTLWTLDTIDTLICGQIYDLVSYNQYGGIPYLWGTNSSNLDMFDAVTGKYILTITGASSLGSKIVGGDGSLLQYSVNTVNGTRMLTRWNSTQCIVSAIPVFYTGAIVSGGSWNPPQDAKIPYSNGLTYIAPLATTYNGVNVTLGLAAYDLESQIAIMTGSGNTIGGSGAYQVGYQVEAGYSMTTGAQLWIINRTLTPYIELNFGPAGNGVYTVFSRQLLTWSGFSTLTGTKLWTTEPFKNVLGYYNWRNNGVMAYGNLYSWTFGGEVYCYNLTTGATQWAWSTGSTEENNPYGVNVLWAFGPGQCTVADGVLYVATGHNYGPPLFNGALIYAINATTGGPASGQLIWSFLNFASMSSLPVVDGYMLSFNAYDNQIYAYGKGNTEITVTTAPGINSNTQVLIEGTVTDQSPGQTCLGIPAAGTPAIADASMSQWMAYLYEQSPKPTNATGVPVTLSYIDPNNNSYTLGTTTSDINGQYSYTFTPDVPGTYTIIATFGGSNSYFSSTAETSMLFNTPPATTAAPTTAPASVADTYFVPAIAGLFVLIIIVLALVVLMIIRKRP